MTAVSYVAELEYPLTTPAPGEVLEVAPGVWWIRMPLPFRLDHVNLWALRDGEGWTLVDTGLLNAVVESTWVRLLDEALAGDPVLRVIATHMHADHVGMAGWLAERFGCELWMTAREHARCSAIIAPGQTLPQTTLDFYQAAGWTVAALENYRANHGLFGRMIHPLPPTFRPIAEGEHISIGPHTWTVIIGTGHSPEHACLYCPALQLFISGDQVLPRITSNVSVFPDDPNANPMQGWLSSLQKIKCQVPDSVLVLPAHNECFRGLHARLDQLRALQQELLATLLTSLDTPQRAVDVFPCLFRREINMGDGMLLSMATGESLANLNYLLHAGQIVKQADEDGVQWYRRTEQAQALRTGP
jgi:glyoxylase-like metal-dependent hydrolase (beta-lactamase superfamily II)